MGCKSQCEHSWNFSANLRRNFSRICGKRGSYLSDRHPWHLKFAGEAAGSLHAKLYVIYTPLDICTNLKPWTPDFQKTKSKKSDNEDKGKGTVVTTTQLTTTVNQEYKRKKESTIL